MSVVTRLIVVQPDARVTEALRYAFERRGAVEVVATDVSGVGEVLSRSSSDEVGKPVIVAGADGDGAELMARLRQAVHEADVPIVYLGNGLGRGEALAAGAAWSVPWPAFLRDVVTVTALVAARLPGSASVARGELANVDGVYSLIRVIAGMRHSAVLTMVRGLRRGEIRFHAGEVTSAQVGTLHGMGALHQLLLWHGATFELRVEDVVRRQQIPMAPDELLADAQRFLAQVREVIRDMDLGAVYDLPASRRRGSQVPAAIAEVLHLMDGTRTVADVVEDSPYLVLDTLRIIERAVSAGVVVRVEAPATGFSFQLLRGLGNTTADEDEVEAEPGVMPDWSDVMPTSMHGDDALAQVVPAASAAGEIVVAARAVPEEDIGRASTEPASSDARIAVTGDGIETFTTAEEQEDLVSLAAVPSLRGARTRPVPRDSEPILEPPGKADDSHTDTGVTNAEGKQPMRQQTKPAESDESEARSEGAPAGTSEVGSGAATSGAEPAGPGFTDDEEAFFRAGASLGNKPAPPAERFDDLDAGYQPKTFWQRLFGGRRPKRPATEDAPGRDHTTGSQPAVEPAPRQTGSQPAVETAPAARPQANRSSGPGKKRKKRR